MSVNQKKQKAGERQATFGMSLLVLAVAIIVLMVGILVLQLSPHIPLLVCTFVLVFYGLYLKIPWSDMMGKAFEAISSSLEAIIIIMTIGMVVGAWVACGTVPFVIYWELKIFSPAFILPFTVVLCAIMSTLTGSSWTTVGTIGVAFLGIGLSMGIPAPIIVGAICCGSFFGDAQSPMSDGCNFATAISGAGLYNGVKGMLCTNIPALLISIVAYIIIGLGYSSKTGAAGSETQILDTLAGLEQGFNLTPLVLIPAVVLFILIAIKLPAIPTMILAAFSGVVIDVICQHESIAKALTYLMDGYVGNTGVEDVDRIITRGGLSAMMGTVAIVIFSMWMAGVLQRIGIIPVILSKVSGLVKRIVPLVFFTNLLTFIFSYFAADPYLAMILPANILGGKYDEMDIDRSVLSRTLEDGGTVVCPMVPWGTNGIYCSQTLGLSVMSYLPYYFLGIFTPVCTLVCAVTGFGIRKKRRSDGE